MLKRFGLVLLLCSARTFAQNSQSDGQNSDGMSPTDSGNNMQQQNFLPHFLRHGGGSMFNPTQSIQSQIPQGSSNFIQQLPNMASGQSVPAMQPGMPSPQPNVYGPLATNWSTCPNGFLCCGQSVYKDTYKLLQCCGEQSFDTRFQKCEQGTILPLVSGMPTPTPADRLIRINCGGYLYITSDSYRCCNFAVYDPDDQMCISGQVQTRPTPQQAPLPLGSVYVVCGSYRYLLSTQATLTWGCCANQLYNYNQENCTGGAIEPVRTPNDQAQVPRGELMIFCTGKRHWIDPDNLASTRCCGTEICPLQSAPTVLTNANSMQPSYQTRRRALAQDNPFDFASHLGAASE
jgi:hypothetical protein